ncbi:MAG: hypothetical protein JW821_00630, partial [Deltaproteobacteria bacterium]|nr:hypothetical protein [Deltaproteobacteria bacterium]
RKFDFPLAPICLAVILGPLVESNLARTLTISHAKDIHIILLFFTRPICVVLIGLTMLSLLTPFLTARAAARRTQLLEKAAADSQGDEIE